MNQPKRNLKIWIPIAAVLCFWLGDWMGYTYELTEGTTTHRLADLEHQTRRECAF